MADTLRMKPYLGIWYMAVNLDRPPLHDIRIRKAISLSIDREAIVDRIYKLGDRPAYGMIPPGIANYPWSPALDFANVPYAERIREAQALMRAAGYGPQNRLVLDYETTTTPDNKRLAAAFQSMLKLTYIDVRIAQADLQVHFANMALHNFEIGAASWIADFNDASNFLDLLRWDNGKNNNYGGYRNPDFDALLDRAQQEADATKRGQMLRQAEQIAINDYALIPVRFLVTKNLVQPYVKGFVSNVRDFNRTRWLWIDGKPLPR
jgi:oligopeptide transport system substrate-binding protein